MITSVMGAEAINNLCPLGGITLRGKRLNLRCIAGSRKYRALDDNNFAFTAQLKKTRNATWSIKSWETFQWRPHLGRAQSTASPYPARCFSPADRHKDQPQPGVEESRASAPPSRPHRTGFAAEVHRRTLRPAVTRTILQLGNCSNSLMR